MHHTIAWRVSLAASAVATDMTPVTDGIMTVQNAHFLPQKDYFLQYAYFGAAEALRARFITPNWRQISTPWIRPVNLAIVPLDEPNIADYTKNPLRIRGLEELQVEGYQANVGALIGVAVAGISDTPLTPVPMGDVIAMRGTGTTTATAGAWTQATITWQDTLPNGQYAVVGLGAIGVTMIAARLIFEDQVLRPGALAQSLVSGNPPAIFRDGSLGIWGRFNAYRIPSVEIFCNAADTAQEIYLHLMRVG